jgi:hypothetical protein
MNKPILTFKEFTELALMMGLKDWETNLEEKALNELKGIYFNAFIEGLEPEETAGALKMLGSPSLGIFLKGVLATHEKCKAYYDKQ